MLTIGTGGPAGLFDLLEEEWTTANGARDEILPCLVQAFSSTPLTSFVRFHDFAEYQAAIESPLGRTGQTLTAGGQETALGEPPSQGWRRAAETRTSEAAPSQGWRRAAETRTSEAAQFSEEALEERWKSFLGIFLGRCLVSLDGAEAGATEEGSPCFRLTAQGRRMLGLPGDGQGDMSAPDQASPAIIVQPNFEIVFLAPSPAAEAELGRFCERKGRDVGVLFRITKESIRAAAASGLDARRVLDPLQQYARSELPPNVRQEIQGWLNRADLDSVPPAP